MTRRHVERLGRPVLAEFLGTEFLVVLLHPRVREVADQVVVPHEAEATS